MNLLSTTRLAVNTTLVVAAAAITVFAVLGGSIESRSLILLGGIAVLGAIAQFAVSIVSPGTIRPTWDEQNVAAHRGSYQFGYWLALIGFWVFLGLNHWLAVDLETAFLWMGVILVSIPSVWMVLATLFGRAG
ncbi:MAG: hypothetical protein HWE23_01805 [Rhodobacteraceae bacterium]|nr:hypothetical protein [Paracoccaceae bacterium]